MSLRVTKTNTQELVVGVGENPVFNAANLMYDEVYYTEHNDGEFSIMFRYLYKVGNKFVAAPLSFFVRDVSIRIDENNLQVILDWERDEQLIKAHKHLYRAMVRHIGNDSPLMKKLMARNEILYVNPNDISLARMWLGCKPPISVDNDGERVNKGPQPTMSIPFVSVEDINYNDEYLRKCPEAMQKTLFVTPSNKQNDFGSDLDYHHDVEKLRPFLLTGAVCFNYERWFFGGSNGRLDVVASSVLVSRVEQPGRAFTPSFLLREERQRRRNEPDIMVQIAELSL